MLQQEGQVRIPSGCAISAVINKKGICFSGERIIKSIALMHDLYKPTADASKRIIPQLVSQGYQLVTVEELRLLKGYKLKPGRVYTSFR